jgi:hypothetical protein
MDERISTEIGENGVNKAVNFARAPGDVWRSPGCHNLVGSFGGDLHLHPDSRRFALPMVGLSHGDVACERQRSASRSFATMSGS